jgi:hypothetical protein
MEAVQAMFEIVDACRWKHAGHIVDAGSERRQIECGGGTAEQAPNKDGDKNAEPQ